MTRPLPFLALLLVVGCSATQVPVQPRGDSQEPPPDSGDSGGGSGGDTDTEDLPNNDAEPWDTPELCHVSLECSQTIPDEPKVPCQLVVETNTGRVLYEGWAGAEERGRSSNAFAKHQYAIELWYDETGRDVVEVDFWTMGSESDWILNGNYADRALFRNKLGYDLFNAFDNEGEWASESVLCDLRLDGEWLGVFTWGERAKRDSERIPVGNVDDGTSWIVKNDDSSGFMSSSGFYAYWQLVWPRQDEVSADAKAAVTAEIQGFQAAVAGADPEAIWLLVDLDSAVDFVITHELSRNNDAYFLSVYMWKDSEGLIHFTPWDLDLAFGGYPISSCGWDAWVSYRSTAITAFAESATFRDRLAQRWHELREGPMATDEVLARMDRYTEVMGDALYGNFEVWPITEIDFCWSGDCYLCPVDSVDYEQEYVREWATEHLAWMDANIESYQR